MARLLVDENFPRPVAVELRRRGHDVVDLEYMGLADRGVPDTSVLDMAASDGRAVLTLDRRDFARLHQERTHHSGIVACTLDLDSVGMAARIDTALTAIARLDDQFIRIVRPGPTRP